MSNGVIEAHIIQDGDQIRCILPESDVFTVKANTNGGRSSLYEAPPSDHEARPTKGIYPEEETSGYRWAPWGREDTLPTDIRTKIYSVPMASRAIYQLTQMMYGNGLCYVRNDELKQGPKVKRAYIPKVEQFIKKNRLLTHWLPAQLMDYRFYMNGFSEMAFNGRKDLITNIWHKKAEFSRLSIQNPDTGKIEYLYYSPRFAQGYSPTRDEIHKVQLFDWVNEEEYLSKIKGHKMAWHSYFPTPGTEYYARPLWLGLFKKDGWLDVSAAVPKIVSSMQHNQLIIKYHILIPESYFEIRHSNWAGYTDKQRKKVIDAYINKINSSLQGVDNIYTSISTVFREDIQTRQPLGKVEIIPVDDKLKKDAWVPSSDKADAQIVQGLGLHPSQVGLEGQGGKMGAGSGSDQRESFNTGISLNTLDQMIVLEPLNWLSRFNAQTDPEWDITWMIDHTHHTTTNKQESGMVPGENTLEIE